MGAMLATKRFWAAFMAFAVFASACGGDDPATGPSQVVREDASGDARGGEPDVTIREDAVADAGTRAEANGDTDASLPTDADASASPDADAGVPSEKDAGEAGDAPRDQGMPVEADAPREATADAGADVSVSVEGSLEASSDATNESDGGAPILISIEVTPRNPAIAPRTSIALTATGVFYDPATAMTTTQDLTRLVTWSSDGPLLAMVSNTPGFQGRVTMIQGSTTVMASRAGVSGTTDIHELSPSLVEISMAPTRLRLPLGVPMQLYTAAIWSTGDRQDVTGGVIWSSSNASVAAFEGAPGVIVGKALGPATLTASLANLSDATDILVAAASLASIAVTPNTPTLAKDTAYPFVATGTFTDGWIEDLTPFVTWKSSNEAVATVANPNDKGLVTAVGAGNATITASFGAVAGTASVQVSTATLDAIEVTPPTPSYPMWVTHPLRATGKFSDGSTQDLTHVAVWTPSDVAVAQGRKLGTYTATAKYLGVSGSTAVEVIETTLDSIAVTPASPSISQGGVVQFRAEATYLAAAGRSFKLDLTSEAGWLSSFKPVARVSNAPGRYGLATSLAVGETRISAAFAGVGDEAILTVTP
jgi:hypothetical protein